LAALPAARLLASKAGRFTLAFFCLLPLGIFGTESVLRLFPSEPTLAQRMGEYARNASRPEDRIFVWGYVPGAYYFSERRPASRFVFAQFLTGSTPMTHGMDYDPRKPETWPPVWQRVAMEFRDVDPPLQVYDTSAYVVPRAWEMLFEDFARHRPLLIFDTAPANVDRYGKYPIEKFPRFHTYIREHYHYADSFEGIDVYRRKE
jgi:hypothetical protein